MFPCEIPSAILNQNATKPVKSAPNFNTNEQQGKDGKSFLFKVSTQTQTVKTVTLSKPNFENEDSALEYIINALRTTSDSEDDTPKTSTVTFKDHNKK